MALTLICLTAPAVPIVTDAVLWEHLRVDLIGSPPAPADAAYIALLRAAVTAQLDGAGGVLGRALATQTWRLTLPCFPPRAGGIVLPLPPLQSVERVAYVDAAGVAQELAEGDYIVALAGEQPATLLPPPGGVWPATQAHQPAAVTVDYVAGYGATSAIDPVIVAAALLMIKALYDQRESVVVGKSVAVSPTIEALIAPRRVAVIA